MTAVPVSDTRTENVVARIPSRVASDGREAFLEAPLTMSRVQSLSKFVAASAAMLSFAQCSSESDGTDNNLGPVGSSTLDSTASATTASNPTMPPAQTTASATMPPTSTDGAPSETASSSAPQPSDTGPVMTDGPGGAGGSTGGSAGADNIAGAGGAGGGRPAAAGNGGMGGEGGAGETGGAGGNEATAGAGGASPDSPDMSSGCGTEPTIPSNMYNNGERISIMAAGMQRRYILRVPDNYDNTRPYKLIIAWHQRDGNDVQMYANDYYHLLPLSNDSTIFVAPNGQKNGSPCTTTANGDGSCGWPNPNGSDIALADAVVNELKENFCIDTNRIFATGWSYGGSMSYKTACERGLGGTKDGVDGYIRGIAVYSGAQLSGQCTPSTPVAYYGSHGTSDNVLGYDGGVGLAQNFATANGCSWSGPQRATGNHVCTDVMGCPTEYPVQFCSFTGGHTPDPSDGGGGSWQYQLVWDFFDQF